MPLPPAWPYSQCGQDSGFLSQSGERLRRRPLPRVAEVGGRSGRPAQHEPPPPRTSRPPRICRKRSHPSTRLSARVPHGSQLALRCGSASPTHLDGSKTRLHTFNTQILRSVQEDKLSFPCYPGGAIKAWTAPELAPLAASSPP